MLNIIRNQCLLCSGCLAVCPETALRQAVREITIDHSLCTLCRICINFCPVTAISITDNLSESKSLS